MQGFESNSKSNDTYEHPTPQIVYITGKTCVEPVSLPNVQQYYSNITRLNKDYAFFKLVYFDFPLNDSIEKIIGEEEQVNVKFDVWYTPTVRPKEWQYWEEDMRKTKSYTVGQKTIYLKGVKNSNDMAYRIKDLLVKCQALTEDEQAIGSPVQYVFSWLSDFAFDSATQKFAFHFRYPDSILDLPFDDTYVSPYSYIKRVNITFSSSRTGQAAKLLAKLFGGVVNDDGTWQSEFDTGFTQFFTAQKKANEDTDYATYIHLDTLISTCHNTPQMFVDSHVYIRGTPESSTWTPDGLSTDVIGIQPRNRPAGTISPQQAFLTDQTHSTKTHLSSLRNMTLRFTDKDGNLLQLNHDYTIKIAIGFNV